MHKDLAAAPAALRTFSGALLVLAKHREALRTLWVNGAAVAAILDLRRIKAAALDAARAAVAALPDDTHRGLREEAEEDAILLPDAPPDLLRDMAGRWANAADKVALRTSRLLATVAA